MKDSANSRRKALLAARAVVVSAIGMAGAACGTEDASSSGAPYTDVDASDSNVSGTEGSSATGAGSGTSTAEPTEGTHPPGSSDGTTGTSEGSGATEPPSSDAPTSSEPGTSTPPTTDPNECSFEWNDICPEHCSEHEDVTCCAQQVSHPLMYCIFSVSEDGTSAECYCEIEGPIPPPSVAAP